MREALCVVAILAVASSIPAQSAPQPGTASSALSIDDAIREALDRNLDLIAEKFNLSLADAKLITARLRPNPILSLGGDHLDVLGTGYNAENQAGPPEYSIRTDFLFERGRKRQNRVTVAETSRSVVELQLLNTTRTLTLDVENAFIDVQLAKENLTLAQENLRAFGDLVRVNQLRVRGGDLAEVELIRTQLAELQFENAVRQAELKLTTARNRLKLLIGRGRSGAPVEVTGELRRAAPTFSPELIERTAFEFRPDLLAVQRDQARSLADIRLQLAQGRADYTVGAEYRRQQGLAGRGNSLGVFVTSTIPVFNRNQGEIERAQQEQKQIEARIRALRNTIEIEVQTAYSQYSNAKVTLDRLEETMLTKAKDVRQITEFSYRRGEATLIEFLDAQRAYNDTIQAYNEARAEFSRSLYLIDSIAGRAVNP